jgi:isoleucyl-tRNA synthetase
LRLWVCASDYADDLRIGPEILKNTVETYRKLRNILRWMLGSLAHFRPDDVVTAAQMPELERVMLHRLAELDAIVRTAYAEFDYKRVIASLTAFMNTDLSAFYVDVRKDVLYCDPISSVTRKASLTMIDILCDALLRWLAPILPFTCEEAWLAYRGDAATPEGAASIHLLGFPAPLGAWRDDALADKWRKVRTVRRVVTGALEIERAAKRIGSSLEAAPVVYVSDLELRAALAGVDLAEVAITSAVSLREGDGPAGAFRLDDVAGVAVEVHRAEGRKCARSWKILPTVGSDPAFPDVSPRDAKALREWEAVRSKAAV